MSNPVDAGGAGTVIDGSESPDAEVMRLLTGHRTLGGVPESELRWLAAHGSRTRFEGGRILVGYQEPVDFMYVLFSGDLSFYASWSGGPRKILAWHAGDVIGYLPYSRVVRSPGDGMADTALDVLALPRALVRELPMHCPGITERLVHVMLDRARTFTSSGVQESKLASLGKLSAGIAHELNNPASAASRSARLLRDAFNELDAAAREVGALRLSSVQLDAVECLRVACATSTASIESPLERADREDVVAGWLEERGLDVAQAAPLADTGIAIEALDAAATAVPAAALPIVIRWVASACATRSLVADVERASTRVYELVSAVKRFTYMDRATVPEPVDIGPGLRDTVAVMASKARTRSIAVDVDIAPDLPPVRGRGGELNQVWTNLLDNALDAAAGRVAVRATRDGNHVTVRFVDDGAGIPAEIRDRIFDPFFTTKGVGQGTGLGLDAVRRILISHDASIDVDSVAGRTEMRVRIPVVSAPSSPTPPGQ